MQNESAPTSRRRTEQEPSTTGSAGKKKKSRQRAVQNRAPASGVGPSAPVAAIGGASSEQTNETRRRGSGQGGSTRRNAKSNPSSQNMPSSSAGNSAPAHSNQANRASSFVPTGSAPAQSKNARRQRQKPPNTSNKEQSPAPQSSDRDAAPKNDANASVSPLQKPKKRDLQAASASSQAYNSALLSAPNAKIIKVAVRRVPRWVVLDDFLSVAAERGCDMREGAQDCPMWSSFSNDSMGDVPYACFYAAWRTLPPAQKLRDAMNGFRFQEKKSGGKSMAVVVERAQYNRIPNGAASTFPSAGGGRKGGKNSAKGNATATQEAQLSGCIFDDDDYKNFLAAHAEAANESNSKHASGIAPSALLPALGALSLKEELQKPKQKPGLLEMSMNRNGGAPVVTPLMQEVREKRRDREARRAPPSSANEKRSSSTTGPSPGAASGSSASASGRTGPAALASGGMGAGGGNAAGNQFGTSSSKKKSKSGGRSARSGAKDSGRNSNSHPTGNAANAPAAATAAGSSEYGETNSQIGASRASQQGRRVDSLSEKKKLPSPRSNEASG